MSKVILIVPTTFTIESGAVKSHFATKVGLREPDMYGYLLSNGGEWSIYVGNDKAILFKKQGLTAQLLMSELRRLPDCTLLVSPYDADRAEALLRGALHEVRGISYQGVLKTGSW